MSRAALNFVIDTVTFLVMLAMLATGLILKLVLPPGSGGGQGEGGVGMGMGWRGGRGGEWALREQGVATLWGLGRHDWGEVHFWLAVSLLAVLVVHAAMHWGWVVGMVRRSLGGGELGSHSSKLARAGVGVAFLVGVAGVVTVFVWWASASIVRG